VGQGPTKVTEYRCFLAYTRRILASSHQFYYRPLGIVFIRCSFVCLLVRGYTSGTNFQRQGGYLYLIRLLSHLRLYFYGAITTYENSLNW